jgi:hypothetical protein
MSNTFLTIAKYLLKQGFFLFWKDLGMRGGNPSPPGTGRGVQNANPGLRDGNLGLHDGNPGL